MRAVALFLGLLVLFALALGFWGRNDLANQILALQRELQNSMAGQVRDIKAGVAWAEMALIGVAFAYGFIHSAGPGHGKALMGGAALGSKIAARKLSLIAFAASMAQGLWAVVLVYGGLGLAVVTARQLNTAADQYLMPLSYSLIGLIGLFLIWRGLRSLPAAPAAHKSHDHHHDQECGCSHKHAPDMADIDRLSGYKAVLALIVAIAVRPCTGAIMLLVICWQIGLVATGFWAVMAMAFGTALVTIIAANAGVMVRDTTLAWVTGVHKLGRLAFPAIQIAAGLLIAFAASSVLLTLLA
ncbi:MAG: hypothetical protein WD046_13560 [Paracoccaceae bacterium]